MSVLHLNEFPLRESARKWQWNEYDSVEWTRMEQTWYVFAPYSDTNIHKAPQKCDSSEFTILIIIYIYTQTDKHKSTIVSVRLPFGIISNTIYQQNLTAEVKVQNNSCEKVKESVR